MGAAQYIGRVGGLAVALGVGTAIATGHGIAAADSDGSTNDTGGSQSASVGGSDTGTSSTGSSATSSTASSTSSTSSTSTVTRDDGEPGDSAGSSGGSGGSATKPRNATKRGQVSAQTNTGSLRGSRPSKADESTPASAAGSTTSSSTSSTTQTTGSTPSSKSSESTEPTGNTGSTETTGSTENTSSESTDTTPPEDVHTDDTETADTATPGSQPSEDAPPRTGAESTPEPTPQQQVSGDTGTTGESNRSLLDAGPDPALPAANAVTSPTLASTTVTARQVERSDAAASTRDNESPALALFADARDLAAAGPLVMSPPLAATLTDTLRPKPATVLTAVADAVTNIVRLVLTPFAGTSPVSPAQPPLIWSLLAFARREFDNFFTALAGRSTGVQLAAPVTTALALAAVPSNPRPGFPTPGQQLSPSTSFVDWVTGNYPPNNTQYWYGVTGTDIGVIWDNGMEDDPSTPYNEHQVLMAFGDTFGIRGYPGDHWRPNILFRSSDTDLSDGITLADPEWFTGNDFGDSPLTWVPDGAPYQYMARQIIFPEGLPAGITLIPTAGVSVPTPGTKYGVTQYISFMSVTRWGSAGRWTTNYSAIAYSEDNGETWHVAPETVRYNNAWSGNKNFQQMAFVRPGDGYVYVYGTPNGRQGYAYLARVPEEHILDLSQYEYYSAGRRGLFTNTPAGWYKGDPSVATPVFGKETGACGVGRAGNRVSEMSVQYNEYLGKYVVLYGDQFDNIVIRTADRPEGPWSSATVLIPQQNGGIYAPMMHPWSPSTQGTGPELYWNLSLWSEYNVMLMRTDLSKL